MPPPLRTYDAGRDKERENRPGQDSASQAETESQDARAWVTVGVVVVIVLLAYLGISAGMLGTLDETADSPASSTRQRVETPPPPPIRETPPGGYENLGVLPGLLDDFSTTPDCDFDDALSSCQ